MSLNAELTKNAAAKSIMSRIALKIDTWQNWQDISEAGKKGRLILHAGEIAFVQMGTVPPMPEEDGYVAGTSEVLFKVGDGINEFQNLPWGSAKAADVYGWAKKDEADFKNWLSGATKVGGDGEDKDNPVIGDPFVLKSVFDGAVTSINNTIVALTEATTDTTKPASLASRLAVVEELAGVGEDGVGALATVEYVDEAKKALIGADTTVDTIKYAIKQASEAGTAAGNAATIATRAEGKADTLIGTDTGKSARDIAVDALTKALVPNNAQESLNTLQEIAAWIQSHPEDAAELNRLLSGLGDKTTGEGENAVTKAKTVKEYVDEVVGAEGTARSTAITNAINALDMNKVSISAGETVKEISETDGVVSVSKQSIAITKSQITDFSDDDYADAGHDHDGKYADKTTTEQHIANGDIHVTKPEKESWNEAAPKAQTAIQGVKVNGRELIPDANKKVDVLITTGTNNGNIKVNDTDVPVKGLGSAAFTDSTAYASSTDYTAHKSKAVTTDTYLLIDCGTSTINVS